jgi:hypothetical protein
MIEVTEWAREILGRSQSAARRFNPDTVIRLVRGGPGVEARLAESAEGSDQAVELGEMTLYVEDGLEGVVDIQEPHDQVVLKPPGSAPNVRGEH